MFGKSARVFLAGPPDRSVDVPLAVLGVATGRRIRAVWVNQLGGLTFEVGMGGDRCFVKWTPAGSELDLDLEGEAARMAWVAPFSPVPRVLAAGSDATGRWLVTAPLPGESAVADRWKRQPAAAVAAIGVGLRHLHESAPVAECPFSWSVADRVANAHRRVTEGVTDLATWHPVHHSLAIETALSIVDDPPPAERLVVCHGDACAPNTLIDRNGRWSGHVDLGSLGVADPWADLAIATWSTEWNYGPGWEPTLLDAYEIAPDPERIAYYRLLWDLT